MLSSLFHNQLESFNIKKDGNKSNSAKHNNYDSLLASSNYFSLWMPKRSYTCPCLSFSKFKDLIYTQTTKCFLLRLYILRNSYKVAKLVEDHYQKWESRNAQVCRFINHFLEWQFEEQGWSICGAFASCNTLSTTLQCLGPNSANSTLFST